MLMFYGGLIDSIYSIAQNSDQEIKETIQNEDLPARTVKFELSEIEGSSGYDVELVSIDRVWKKNHSFKISGKVLRVRLASGRYRVRTRTYNIENINGDWSQWRDFFVEYKPVENIYPQEGALIKPISKEDEKIIFEWPEIKGVFAYLFEVRTIDDEIIEKKIIKNYFRTVQLPIGQKYKWNIQPLAYEGQEKTIKRLSKYNTFEVGKPIPNTTPISINVDGNQEAVRYEYEFVRFLSYTETTPPIIYESVLPEFRASLEPSEYELRVRAIYRNNKKSDWGPGQRFYVPFTSAAGKYPKENEIFNANHPKKSEVEIAWHQVDKAKKYILYVFNDQNEVVNKISTEKEIAIVKLPAGARYHYHVQAYSYREKERKPPSVGSRTIPFVISEYVYQKFSEAEEPSDLYGWANWVGSTVNYKSKNFDNNSLTTNNIFGGTGQLAIGYWERYTKLGLLLFGEMSGFTIADKTYQYSTYGVQLGKRFILDEGSRARIWFGWATKDLPELVTYPLTTFLDVQQVQARGIYIQANYLKPMTEKYSLYLVGSYFQDIGQNNTPNGLDLEYLRGGALGAYISKSLGEKYKGRIGYSYKFDSSSYKSTESGFKNRVDISGHYVSFLFEFALQEPDDF